MKAVGVIFDMDGTLLRLDVDIEAVRLSLAELFAPFGVSAPFRPILRRIPEAAREAAARGGDAAALERQGLAILDRHEVAQAASARARPGVVDIVTRLDRAGVPLAVVTDNGRACAGAALAAAGFPVAAFRAVVTRDDVPRPKPDPSGILFAARALGLPVSASIWYIGDHAKDVEAGRAAARTHPGLRVAALCGGYATRADLERARPDAMVADPMEILSLVEQS